MTNDEVRPPPIPTADRAKQTAELIERGGTDIDRWRQSGSLATAWSSRAHRAASYIPDGSSVLDIGCGAMDLKQHLKPACRYTPADVVARSADCLVIDLNQDQFPPGRFDWITMLGVLEYIHTPQEPLKKARLASPNLLFTYCCDTSGNIAHRRGLGWVNDFTANDVRALIAACGWTLMAEALDKQGAGNDQLMFVCK